MRRICTNKHKEILRLQKFHFNSNINFKNNLPSQYKTSKRLTKEDCLTDIEEYKKLFRKDAMIMRRNIKNRRRLNIGPFSSIVFENYDTIFVQIHEMVCIEFGNSDSFEDEIDAYNSLIPDGNSLIGVFMIEIENEKKRAEMLKKLSYIENFISLKFENENIPGVPINPDRTDENGKTSSIHFLKFNFTNEQIRIFKESSRVIFAVEHDEYNHSTVFTKEAKESVAEDFDN